MSVSVTCNSLETACRNLVTFHIKIKYDLGIMHIFSQFRYVPIWLSGSQVIDQGICFAPVLEKYRRYQFCLKYIIMLLGGVFSPHTVRFQIDCSDNIFCVRTQKQRTKLN